MRSKKLVWISMVVLLGLTAATYGLVSGLIEMEGAKQEPCGGPMDKAVDLALAWADDANQLCPAVVGIDGRRVYRLVEGSQLASEKARRAGGAARSPAICAPRQRGRDVNASFGEPGELGRKSERESCYWNENVLNRIDVKTTRLHGGGGRGREVVKAIGLLVLLPPAFSGLVLVSRVVFRR